MKRNVSNFGWLPCLMMASLIFLSACATSKIQWDHRVGDYTYDQAVLEFGPPERSAKLSDGRIVSEWLMYRSRYSSYPHFSPGLGGYWFHNGAVLPDRFLRLTFSPEGRLESWKNVTK